MELLSLPFAQNSSILNEVVAYLTLGRPQFLFEISQKILTCINQFRTRTYMHIHIRHKITRFTNYDYYIYASSSLLTSTKEIGSYKKKFTYTIKSRHPLSPLP